MTKQLSWLMHLLQSPACSLFVTGYSSSGLDSALHLSEVDKNVYHWHKEGLDGDKK